MAADDRGHATFDRGDQPVHLVALILHHLLLVCFWTGHIGDIYCRQLLVNIFLSVPVIV